MLAEVEDTFDPADSCDENYEKKKLFSKYWICCKETNIISYKINTDIIHYKWETLIGSLNKYRTCEQHLNHWFIGYGYVELK